MKIVAWKSNKKFCIAIGAVAGVAHVLFRGLTVNLGPIAGLTISAILVAAMVVGIYAALELAVGPATHVPGSRER